MRKYTCGVPKERCTGTTSYDVNTRLRLAIAKVHNSPAEAFNCHARYLTSIGYKRIGSREFDMGDGLPVRVLTKKSKFGGVLRTGKHEQAKAKRLVSRHETFGGMIASL